MVIICKGGFSWKENLRRYNKSNIDARHNNTFDTLKTFGLLHIAMFTNHATSGKSKLCCKLHLEGYTIEERCHIFESQFHTLLHFVMLIHFNDKT